MLNGAHKIGVPDVAIILALLHLFQVLLRPHFCFFSSQVKTIGKLSLDFDLFLSEDEDEDEDEYQEEEAFCEKFKRLEQTNSQLRRKGVTPVDNWGGGSFAGFTRSKPVMTFSLWVLFLQAFDFVICDISQTTR